MTRSGSPPRVLPPHYLATAVLTVVALGLWSGGGLLPAPWPYLGVLLIVPGIVLAARGSRQFARAGTNIIPLTESNTLVRDGVFRLSRNPMYLGMLAALVGVALLANTAWAWPVVGAFFLVIRQGFVLKEEALLLETFGDDYLNYQSTVRRWL